MSPRRAAASAAARPPARDPLVRRRRHATRLAVLMACAAAIVVALVGCGGSRAHRKLVMSSDRGNTVLTCAARAEACVGLPHRGCGQHRLGSVSDGIPLEVDTYGTDVPSCAAALTQLRRAATRSPPRRIAEISGWRCRRDPEAMTCSRPGAVLWAQDPGE